MTAADDGEHLTRRRNPALTLENLGKFGIHTVMLTRAWPARQSPTAGLWMTAVRELHAVAACRVTDTHGRARNGALTGTG